MTSPTPNIHRWRAFSLLAVAAFMTVMDLTIVNTALPTIGRKLHFSQTSLLWVVTAYGLAYGGFLLLGGRAADLLGRRRVIIAGLAVFTAASLGASLAGSEAVLIAMRAVQGLGAATVPPSRIVDCSEHVHRGRRAQQGARYLGRSRRPRCDLRGRVRRPADAVRRMAVRLPAQRPGRRGRAAARPAGRARDPRRYRAAAL